MATIAGPRTPRPYIVGTFVDVTNSRIHPSLKRSPCRHSNHGEVESTRSLRDSYAEASMKAMQVQQTSIDSSQSAGLSNLTESMGSRSPIAPSGGQIPRIGSRYPASESSTIANRHLSAQESFKLTENQPGTVVGPATPVKTLSEKPLPPKPALRFYNTPEKRVIFDATDLKAIPLDDHLPPLEPVSTTEPARSDQLSPVSSSFHVTPSLLSRKHSSNSISTDVIEYGTASVTSIQPVINRGEASIIDHSGNASSRKYMLNVSRSSRIPRRNSLLNSGQKSYGSPSRQSSLGNKVTHSVLHRRETKSTHPEIRDVSQHSGVLTALTSDVILERTRTKDYLEEHVTEEGTLRTSLKYGYNIRESFEARDAIMGHSNSRNRVNSLLSSRSNYTATSYAASAREISLKLATPDTKSESKKANIEDGQKDNLSTALRTGYPTLGQPRGGNYPTRTSSLPNTPSSQQPFSSDSKPNISFDTNLHKIPVPKTQVEGIYSGSSQALPMSSQLSLFHRPTTTSATRAPPSVKNIREPRHTFSRIPRSRTLASLNDVRIGVKNLGKKVSKIIPGRRNIEVKATTEELLTINNEHMHGPRRQASRLLTTYKNSGMNNKLGEGTRLFSPTGNRSIEPEPVDHHETEETDKQKWVWRKGSRSVAYDTETGRFMPFDQGAGDSYDEDEDEDRPPHRRGVLSAPAHYIETDDENDEPEEDGDTTVGGEEADDPNLIDREDALDEQLPPPRSSNIGGTGAVTDSINQPLALNAENSLDSLIAETDTRVREFLVYAMSLHQSHHRNLLIESATHLGEGVMHIRQARIETVRVTQLLEEIAAILSTHLLSLTMQQSSATSRAP